MTRALAAALGLMVTIATPPAAAQVQIFGPGTKSCGAWTADRTTHGKLRPLGISTLLRALPRSLMRHGWWAI
jgi:hypothetical protein